MIAAVSNKKLRCLRPRKTLMIWNIKGNPSIGSTRKSSKCLKRYLNHRRMKLYVRRQKMLCFSTNNMSISIIQDQKANRSKTFIQLNSRALTIKNLCRSRRLTKICQWIETIRNVSTSAFKTNRLWKEQKQGGPKTLCSTYRQKKNKYLSGLRLASFPGNYRALLVKKSLSETKRS